MTTITLPEWTSETPTQPGVYRFRSISDPETPVWLEFAIYPYGDMHLEAFMFGNSLPLEPEELRGAWQGPIEVSE
jgi:hypothetical protein